jgi:hypothetical protein
MDILAVILIAVLFALSFSYVSGCDRLKGTRP